MNDKQTILFEVVFDEKDTSKKAAGTRVAIERLRDARRELAKDFQKGNVSADEYGDSLQAIERQLAAANTELKGYSKALDQNDKVQNASRGSINRMRAELSSLTSAYDSLSDSERDNERVGGRMEARIKTLSANLLILEGNTGRMQRNVGNYSGAIEPLIRELVKLEEIQKRVGNNTPEYKKVEREMIGFRQQINQVGQTTGQTFDDIQDKVKSYGDSIRPTIQQLIALEQEQVQLGDVGSEAFERIGFEIANVNRQLAGLDVDESADAIVDSIDAIGEEIADLEKKYNALSKAKRDDEAVGGALLKQINSLKDAQEKNNEVVEKSRKGTRELIKEMNILGVNVGDTIQSFKSGAQGVGTFAKSIFTTRGAFIALGAVPIILFLTAIVSFFTRTKDGAELLSRKMAALTAVFDFFAKGVSAFGGKLVDAFSNPVQAIKDLGSAIGENLTNRLSAVGEIVGAIANLDPKRALNGFLQLITGVKDVTGKVGEMVSAIDAAATAGERVAKQAQKIADLERQLSVDRANARADIEKYKFISEDVNRTIEERIAASKRAFTIENGLLSRQQSLQRAKIANLKQENALHGTTAEGLNKIAEAEKELGDTRQESIGLQTELNNKINELTTTANQQRIQAQLATLNEGLRVTRDRGFQTLEIEKQILDKQLELDLVGVTKNGQVEKALRLKYKADMAQLIYNDALAQNERQIKLENSRIQAEIDLAAKGSQAELDLKFAALKQQTFQEEATARLTIKNAEELEAELNRIKAKGTKDRLALIKQATQEELAAQQTSLGDRLATAREGSKEEYDLRVDAIYNAAAQEINALEEVEEEREKRVNEILAKYDKQQDDLRRQRVKGQIDTVLDYAQQANDALSKFGEAQSQAQQAQLDDQQSAALKSAGLSAEARAKIEAKFQKKKADLERDAAIKRKRIATVENIISVARGVTEAIVKNTGNPFLQILQTALVLTTGAAQQAVISAQKFERGGQVRQKLSTGGMVVGASHAYGGVKYNLGNQVVELEGNEGVINKRSMAIPGVREKASELNELGGGVPFHGVRSIRGQRPPKIYQPRTKMELGGVVAMRRSRELTEASQPIDYDRLANKIAEANLMLPAPVVGVQQIQNGIGKRVRVEQAADVGLG